MGREQLFNAPIRSGLISPDFGSGSLFGGASFPTLSHQDNGVVVSGGGRPAKDTSLSDRIALMKAKAYTANQYASMKEHLARIALAREKYNHKLEEDKKKIDKVTQEISKSGMGVIPEFKTKKDVVKKEVVGEKEVQTPDSIKQAIEINKNTEKSMPEITLTMNKNHDPNIKYIGDFKEDPKIEEFIKFKQEVENNKEYSDYHKEKLLRDKAEKLFKDRGYDKSNDNFFGSIGNSIGYYADKIGNKAQEAVMSVQHAVAPDSFYDHKKFIYSGVPEDNTRIEPNIYNPLYGNGLSKNRMKELSEREKRHREILEKGLSGDQYADILKKDNERLDKRYSWSDYDGILNHVNDYMTKKQKHQKLVEEYNRQVKAQEDWLKKYAVKKQKVYKDRKVTVFLPPDVVYKNMQLDLRDKLKQIPKDLPEKQKKEIALAIVNSENKMFDLYKDQYDKWITQINEDKKLDKKLEKDKKLEMFRHKLGIDKEIFKMNLKNKDPDTILDRKIKKAKLQEIIEKTKKHDEDD